MYIFSFEKAAIVVIMGQSLTALSHCSFTIPLSNMSSISSRATKDTDALTLFYRSVGPNNMSEDQFGGPEEEMGKGCVGRKRRKLCGRK